MNEVVARREQEARPDRDENSAARKCDQDIASNQDRRDGPGRDGPGRNGRMLFDGR
jgi:hypothetical protein